MKKEPPVDYALVEQLGRQLCASALEQADPLAGLAALGPAVPTAAALQDWVIELKGRLVEQALVQAGSRTALGEQMGLSRQRVTQMIEQGAAARARREAGTAKGAAAGATTPHEA